MQVLVRNTYGTYVRPSHVFESFWSNDCLFLGPTFPMTSLMELNDSTGLSPFLVLDAKMAFLIHQLETSKTLVTKNLGPLATIGAHLLSGAKIYHNVDKKKFAQYVKEYLPQNPEAKEKVWDQVIVFNEPKINPAFWQKLKIGGYYILATTKQSIELEVKGKFHIIKSKWPKGQETETGWRFSEEELGLEDLEFTKIRKVA